MTLTLINLRSVYKCLVIIINFHVINMAYILREILAEVIGISDNYYFSFNSRELFKTNIYDQNIFC